MSSPHREAAIEAAAKAAYYDRDPTGDWDLFEDPARMSLEGNIAAALDAARPHERAAFQEELLSDEAIDAAVSAMDRPLSDIFATTDEAIEVLQAGIKAASEIGGDHGA